MKRYLLTFLLASVLSGISSAQTEFMNGYIIKNDGSYTYGQVAYITKGYTLKECIFRWFDISAEYIFKPEDIAAFGFTHGMRFKSVSDGQRKIFMACLTDGRLDLLYDGSKLYLNGMGLAMTPLDNGSGSVNAEGKMVSYNGFRDLIEKLPDPDDKFSVPADLSLKPGEMAEVIAGYNRSRGEEAKIFATKNPEGIYEEMRNLGVYRGNYGILAGINASRYEATKVNNLYSGFIPDMGFFEMTPFFGLFYNRTLSRKSDRSSFQGEVMVFKTNVYIYDETVNSSGTTRTDINMSYTGIKMPLYLKISFLKGSIRPFINTGGFVMINLGAKYTREGEIENLLHVVRPYTDNTILLENSLFGALTGVGVRKEFNPRQSVYLEFRAEYGSGIYNKDDTRQQTISFNLMAGFDFL